MAPKMGIPTISKPPEASTITPVELACLVQQYLMENCFPKALQEFQNEAGHLLSIVRTPKSMRSLTVILSEYITLKTFEAHAAAEKARTNQLLQTLYGLLEDFRPGSSKDFVASRNSEPDKKALLQQSVGKENARQAKGKKGRKSATNNGVPPSLRAPTPQTGSQQPMFLQSGQIWPQSGQGAYAQSPPLNLQAPLSSSPGISGSVLCPPQASQPQSSVYRPQANGSGHLPVDSLDHQNRPSVSSPQPPPTISAPLRGPSHSPSSHPPPPSKAVPLGQDGRSSGSPGLAVEFSSSPAPSRIDQQRLASPEEQWQSGLQGSALPGPSALPQPGPGADLSGADRNMELRHISAQGLSEGEQFETRPGSPPFVRPDGGTAMGGNQPMSWPLLDSPGSESVRQGRSGRKEGAGAFIPAEAAEITTPTKATQGGASRAIGHEVSPLKSPHAGRKGTPRKRKMVDQGGPPAPKRVSPNRALFGAQPAAGPEKQPKKALFADGPSETSEHLPQRHPERRSKRAAEVQPEGAASDAGLLDHLELPGDEPMDEAEFRALVVDAFSKDMDVPTRIADHITQALNAGGQGGGHGEPSGGLDIAGDATDWASDGYGLGDACFTDEDIPVDDILAAITADPHVSQLLDSLAETPISYSGFEDFAANENSKDGFLGTR